MKGSNAVKKGLLLLGIIATTKLLSHEIILILTLLIFSFWSLFITYKAISQFLTRQFNGSKIKWILIIMIGFVGPILWISNGKK